MNVAPGSARRLSRADAGELRRVDVAGGVRLVVRRQSRRAADPQRGARRRRDAARRARDERRADEPGARDVRGARGDDACGARPRRLLDARAAQRGRGGARGSRRGRWASPIRWRDRSSSASSAGRTSARCGSGCGRSGCASAARGGSACRPRARRSSLGTRCRSARIVVHDVAYLDWRYAQSPREYLRVDGDDGWAVVSHAVWHGFSSAVICDAPGAACRRCCAGASPRSTRTSRWRW